MSEIRLIDANALREEIASLVVGGKTAIKDAGIGHSWINGLHSAFRCIDNAPTVEIPTTIQQAINFGIFHAENQRKKGEWIKTEFGDKCPFCNVINVSYYRNFCPNCGADMRGNNNGNR